MNLLSRYDPSFFEHVLNVFNRTQTHTLEHRIDGGKVCVACELRGKNGTCQVRIIRFHLNLYECLARTHFKAGLFPPCSYEQNEFDQWMSILASVS